MPQASDALRAEFSDDQAAIAFLKARGFTYTRHFLWEMPEGRDVLTPREWRAVDYLAMEWDWGGLTSASCMRVIIAENAAFDELLRIATENRI